MTAPFVDPLNLEKISASGLVNQLEHHVTLSSTQDRAHELARGGAPPQGPVLIVADTQTAGRGRGTNRWWTGAGSLAFSLIIDPQDWSISRQPAPERSLAVGVAIVDAVQPWLAGIPLGLHWPNDVYAGDRKLAGILIDVLPDGRNIVGIGINANNTLDGAPDEVRQRATTLRDLTGRMLDRTDLLLSVLANLKSCVQSVAADPPSFGARFQDLCLQIGRELTVCAGQRMTTGRCAGIAPDGALLLETVDGWQRFYSGTLH